MHVVLLLDSWFPKLLPFFILSFLLPSFLFLCQIFLRISILTSTGFVYRFLWHVKGEMNSSSSNVYCKKGTDLLFCSCSCTFFLTLEWDIFRPISSTLAWRRMHVWGNIENVAYHITPIPHDYKICLANTH